MISRPWSLPGLSAVYALAQAGSSLAEIAEAVGRFRVEVDLALWALVGRTPPEALERLNRDMVEGMSPQLAGFIAETLP